MSDALDTLRDAEAALAAAGPLPFPLPLGSLAPVVAGTFLGAPKSTWMVCGPRERVGAVLRGCAPERLVDARSGARPYKLAPCSEAPGSRALHAVGLALSCGEPVVCLLGLASAASGSFHEALNVAALTAAPVVFVVVVQELADDAPVGRQLAASPSDLARAHGLATYETEAEQASVRTAVEGACDRGEPCLVEVTL